MGLKWAKEAQKGKLWWRSVKEAMSEAHLCFNTCMDEESNWICGVSISGSLHVENCKKIHEKKGVFTVCLHGLWVHVPSL